MGRSFYHQKMRNIRLSIETLKPLVKTKLIWLFLADFCKMAEISRFRSVSDTEFVLTPVNVEWTYEIE